jgi:queuosine precursor transporter
MQTTPNPQTITTLAIALTGTLILALSLADIAATKFILIGNTVAPGGIFLFSVIFVVRDMLHRSMGADYVKRTIWVAAALNIAMALYFWWITTFDAPARMTIANEWNAIFALAPAIVLGSIIAAVASQLVNTTVYQRLWDKNAPLWQRVIISNSISLPIDSVLFALLAFAIFPPIFGATALPIDALIARIISGQIIIKAIIMLTMTPLVYLIREKTNA